MALLISDALLVLSGETLDSTESSMFFRFSNAGLEQILLMIALSSSKLHPRELLLVEAAFKEACGSLV